MSDEPDLSRDYFPRQREVVAVTPPPADAETMAEAVERIVFYCSHSDYARCDHP